MHREKQEDISDYAVFFMNLTMLMEYNANPVTSEDENNAIMVLFVFRWISVLSNSKQEALSMALDGGRTEGGGGESSVEDLTRAITDDIRRMPGNNNCCDCGAPGNLHSSIDQCIFFFHLFACPHSSDHTQLKTKKIFTALQ